MRVDLDAAVQTRDGEDAGSVQRAVVDPRRNEVTHLVISTGGFLGRDVLVPREEIDRASQDGETIRLELSKAELEQMPAYAPADFAPPPPGWIAPVGYGWPVGAYLWPTAPLYPPGYTYPTTPPTAAAAPPTGGRPEGAPAVEPADQPSIGKGDVVLDRNAEELGVVDDVRFDETTGRLRGVVLRAGGAIRTFFGGGETIDLPADQIERVGEGAVHLKITKDEATSRAR